MRKPKPEQIQAARKLLAEAGYFTDNLWQIKDVKLLYECDDETAMTVLRRALSNDATFQQIWMDIESAAEDLNLKPINK